MLFCYLIANINPVNVTLFAAVVPCLYILEDTVIYANYNNLLLLFIVYKTHILLLFMYLNYFFVIFKC